MNFKRAIIAYLSHKCMEMENARNKKIIFFAIMKPLKGALTTPNRNANQHKKGAYYLWKTKTLKQINLLH
nr:type I restriction endonuclease [Helicobacter pylori]